MEKPAIITAAEQYVVRLLKDRLKADHQFHNLAHTLNVRDAALEIAGKEGLPEADQELLELAALFHDTGFVESYHDHEAVSQEIARDFLRLQHYPEEKIQEVIQAIKATQLAFAPRNLTEQILKDADMAHLGSDTYPEFLQTLRHEWSVFLNQQYADAEWIRLNLEFLKNQVFFTPAAWLLYGPGRDNNLRSLKKKNKKLQKTLESQDKKEALIQQNRSAQLMFKAALRNHLDLSSLADNKANTMLSLNALIITIVVPLAADRLRDLPILIAPLVVLLSACLIAMVFATIATRPIKMLGYTSMEMIREKKSNLFFFGNFFRMEYEQYRKGVELILQEPEILEDSIQRDLFFLGKSLGKKYMYLRICYTVFMGGILASVIVFLASLILLSK